MKRRALLKVTGCEQKRFESYHFRKQLPFTPAPLSLDAEVGSPEAGRHADYTMAQAFQLRVMLDFVENGGLAVDGAQYAARNCIRHLRAASEKVRPGTEIWLVYVQDRPTRDSFGDLAIGRAVKACSRAELSEVLATLDHPEVQFVAMVNASRASAFVYGMALAEGVVAVDGQPIEEIWKVSFPGETGADA